MEAHMSINESVLQVKYLGPKRIGDTNIFWPGLTEDSARELEMQRMGTANVKVLDMLLLGRDSDA
jgi:hypothetical protein